MSSGVSEPFPLFFEMLSWGSVMLGCVPNSI